MNAVLDLKGAVSDELASLRIIEEYVGSFVEKAGNKKQKPKYLDLSFDELFKLSHALSTCANNIERVISSKA